MTGLSGEDDDQDTLYPERSGSDQTERPEILGYEILEPLGHGGMGTVYLARQLEPNRLVAIKILSGQAASPFARERLRGEYRALALMSHNHIAKIYHAGLTLGGRPYFSIEHIQGETVTQYCARTCPSLKERIKLFLQICEGVQHAHQKAFLHRDLKPDNILVTLQLERPVCKIIDFGIAHSLLECLNADGESAAQPGTLGYMSPEQLNGSAGDVRADVYSLGVLLFEMITGVHPLAGEAGLDVEQLKRLPRPLASGCLSSTGQKLNAAQRLYSKRLAKPLKTDLDWVLQKAMALVPEDRYASVSDLNADLQRFLDKQPLKARPPALGYSMGKFFERHRLMVTMLGLVLLSLLLGFSLALRSSIKERRARAHAEQVSTFLKDLLTRANPREQGANVRLVEVLRDANAVFDDEAKDPAFQIEMRSILGQTFLALGEYKEAATHLLQAYALALKTYGEARITWRNGFLLARTYRRQREYARADDLLGAVLAQQRQSLGEQNRDTQESLTELGFLYSEREQFSEAEQLLRGLYSQQSQLFGQQDALTMITLVGLANAVYALTDSSGGDLVEAEELYRRALALQIQIIGERHPETLATRNNLANCLMKRQDYGQAAAMFDIVYRERRVLLGTDADRTLNSGYNLARAYKELGMLDKAGALLEEIGRKWQRQRGSVNQPYNLLARVLAEQGAADQAIKLLASLLDEVPRGSGPTDAQTLKARQNLANYLSVAHLPDQALAELVLLLPEHEGSERFPFRVVALAHITEAQALRDLGQVEAALDLVASTLAHMRTKQQAEELTLLVEAIYAGMLIEQNPVDGRQLLEAVTRAALLKGERSDEILALYFQHVGDADALCR